VGARWGVIIQALAELVARLDAMSSELLAETRTLTIDALTL
jgi:hypothetical protein